MAAKKLSFAITGTGVDELTVAATLCRAGFNVQVYEQAACFDRRRRGHQLAEWL
jgi:2-polyprenyl-6-methoxyphenol hydroxylase-like FAD-dependent oxidoreductase